MSQLSIYDFIDEEKTTKEPIASKWEKKEALALPTLSAEKEVDLDLDLLMNLYATGNYEERMVLFLQKSEEIDYSCAEIKTFRRNRNEAYASGLYNFVDFNQYERFFSENWLSGTENEFLENYGIDGLFKEYYKPTTQVEDFKTFPIINYQNSVEKSDQTVRIFVNYLFAFFEKEIIDDYVRIELPEEFLSRFEELLFLHLNKKREFEELEQKDFALYSLVAPFLETVYLNSSNLSDFLTCPTRQRFFFYNKNKEEPFVYLENNYLCIKVKDNRFPINQYYDFSLMRQLSSLYNVMIFLYLIYDVYDYLIDALAKTKEKTNNIVDEKKYQELFMHFLEERRIDIHEVDHKTSVNKAEKRNLQHFIRPFLNDKITISKGTPLACYKNNAGDFMVLPPVLLEVEDFHFVGIKEYAGYYDEYPLLATRKAPILVGEKEKINAFIDEELFNQVLLDSFKEWKYYEELEGTFKLIEEHALLKNKLLVEEELLSFTTDEVYLNFIPQTTIGDETIEIKRLTFEGSEKKLEKRALVSLDESFDKIYNVLDISLNLKAEPVSEIVQLKNIETDEIEFFSVGSASFYEVDAERMEAKSLDYYLKNELKVLNERTSLKKHTLFVIDRGLHKVRIYWKGDLAFETEISDETNERIDRASRPFYLYTPVFQEVKEKLIERGTEEVLEGINLPFAMDVMVVNPTGFNLNEPFNWFSFASQSIILLEE